MDARNVTKMIARTVVGTSVAFTVSNALAASTYVSDPKPHHKAQVYIGSMVVGAMVAEKARTHTDRFVDSIFDVFKTPEKDDPAVKQA